ncbi:MAG: COP23 domain-containing protein [Stigonema ocellatum SAG 48.90 = DSM 106950]|nr:COP23 domain-containing protein [Stigonema ocellatum SAG 48.90 = DSM 106950]
MQRKALLVGLAITVLTTVATLTVSIVPSFSESQPSEAKPNQVTFFCREVFDQASNSRIPATVAWIPERQIHVRFIGWKSEYFERNGWTPQKRCATVTEKFQQFYSQGRLNYLTYGTVNGYPVICAPANPEETCNSNNQLFTLKSGSNPQIVFQNLIDITKGASSDMILQNSGKQTYLSVQALFKKAPLVTLN